MVGGPPMAASLTPPPEGRRHTSGPRSGVGVSRGMFDVLKDREGSDLDRAAHWTPAPPPPLPPGFGAAPARGTANATTMGPF